MPRIRLLVGPAAIALAVAAEGVAFSWDEPRRWLPDLVVGLTFIGCGYLAWERRWAQGSATLLAAIGVAWFLGNFAAPALYLHRGPLVHLLLAYPGWRARSRLDGVAIGAGYLAALATPVWASERATLVVAIALVAVAGIGWARAAGRRRSERLVALKGATALGVVLAGGAVARLAIPAGDAVEPTLFAYQAVLCAIAVGLLLRLRNPTAPGVADLVVELGERRAGTLRDRLSRTLGDPSLELGYWSAERGSFVDDAGRTLALPVDAGARSVTRVDRAGHPFAVLVHDVAVLDDPALVEAVASTTRLWASNAELQADVQRQLTELMASRRRLLVAADQERQRLERRLREGAGRRLTALETVLARVRSHPAGGDGDAVDRARGRLSRTVEELHELARGLHPRELADAGVTGAVASLAERAPVPVDLDLRVGRLAADVEATAYFVCAEALANVAKYAAASRVHIQLHAHHDRLSVVVADDGGGGADPSRGTGLQGLADRVEALGGTLQVTSPPGAGTRLAAEIPLGGDAR